MIEVLKQRPKKIDQKNLNYIVSWFDKDIVKYQKKTLTWLNKFSYNEIIKASPIFSNKESIDYNLFLSYANQSFTLVQNKFKDIQKDMRLIKKFNKMFRDFCYQEGIYTTIVAINDFYNYIDKNDVPSRKELAIEIINGYILKMYDQFKKIYLNVYNDDKNLQDKIKNVFDLDEIKNDTIFNPIPNIKSLFKFSKLSLSHQKISKSQFNELFINSVFMAYYAQAIIRIYERFTLNLI